MPRHDARASEGVQLRYLGRLPPAETVVHVRATDASGAEEAVSELYLPHRIELTGGPGALDMRLTGIRVGALTAGRLTYGRAVRLTTAVAENFHVNLPLRGSAVSTRGRGDVARTGVGRAAAFTPGDAADIRWSDDCVQLCLMVPRGALESELEALLQRPLNDELRFELGSDLVGGAAQRWQRALQLLLAEMSEPAGLAAFSASGRHLEGLVLDGLLLGLPHSYSDRLLEPSTASRGDATSRAVHQAADLMEQRPGEAWSTTRLAAAVHLGVRTLQEGFSRELQTSPMAYLRRVRLRQARKALVHADAGATTVRSVATELGFVHLGRFTAAYRDAFGENPSVTLRRDAHAAW